MVVVVVVVGLYIKRARMRARARVYTTPGTVVKSCHIKKGKKKP